MVDREVLAVSPRAQSKIAVLPMRPVKHAPCQLRIQVSFSRTNFSAYLSLFSHINLLFLFFIFFIILYIT